MRRRWMALAGLLLLSASLAAGCGQPSAGPRRGAVVERLPRVEIIKARRKRMVRELSLAATVEALQKVDLRARVPGVVKAYTIDIGRSVKAGEVLMRLEVPDLEADLALKRQLVKQAEQQEALARAALEVAKKEVLETDQDEERFKADAEFARSRYEGIRKLVAARAQDERTADEAYRQYRSARAMVGSNRATAEKRKAKVLMAEADVKVARQRIAAARADAQKLTEQVGFATIRAPFDGVVSKRWVDAGATVQGPGEKLLTVLQLERVRVLIDVPQRDIASLNDKEQSPNDNGEGDRVVVRLPSLAEVLPPRGEIVGQVTRVSRSLDPVTRTMRAEVELPNRRLKSGAWLLQPGMYGTATVVVEDRPSVLTLPASAVVRQGEVDVEVLQVTDVTGEGEDRRGVLRRVPVVLGVDDGKEVELRQGKLTTNDWVVLRATAQMREGERVIALSEREAEK